MCIRDSAEAAAKEAGADYVCLDEYIEKIKGGWTDIDVIITMPSIMGKIGALGRVLGPRGLMPNPKSGTCLLYTSCTENIFPSIPADSPGFKCWQRNSVILGVSGNISLYKVMPLPSNSFVACRK